MTDDKYKLRDPFVSGSQLLDEDDAVVLRNAARALALRTEPLDAATCRDLANLIDDSLEGMSRTQAEEAIAWASKLGKVGAREGLPRGDQWRIELKTAGVPTELRSSSGGPVLDEVVIDEWFHIEQLDARTWWLRIGDVRIVVSPRKGNVAHVSVERGAHGDVLGTTDLGESKSSAS